MKYTLDDFQKIFEENTELFELNNETEIIIENLCNELQQIYNKGLVKKTFKKKNKKLEDDWESIRNFKITEFNKYNEDSKHLQNCRKYLNMLTDSNFNKLSNLIMIEIEDNYKNKTINDYNNLCENIFKLICNNILYSNLYSNLYVLLENKFKIFNTILNKSLNNYIDKIESINYIDPQENYNTFCENNKNNELIRAETNLYANLYKDKCISNEIIQDKINLLIQKINNNLIIDNKHKVVEEYSELLYILLSNTYFYLKDDFKQYLDSIIINYTNYKIKDYNSLSNKTLFKFLDIKDDCKINK